MTETSTSTTSYSNGKHQHQQQSQSQQQAKTPLKKEELEQIAKQLKKKLSKAGLTAKQSMSPTNLKSTPNGNSNTITMSLPKSSPLKSYIVNKNRNSSHNFSPISSSPLYSPNNKSPTHMKTPAAMYLSSSPLKNTINEESQEASPTKKRKTAMILEEISPDSKKSTPLHNNISSLKPSIELTSSPIESTPKEYKQTTPTQSRGQLNSNSSQDNLLKTPKQSNNRASFNENEGADLLLYLATSPSPAKPNFYTNTPKIQNKFPQQNQPIQSASAPSSSHNNVPQFIVPPPPVTPKRGGTSSSSINHNLLSKTPQQRLTPFINNLNNSGLPSSGLTLTPNGFSMSDYVNIFTPSPGSLLNKNLLKSPDFNNLLNSGALSQTPRGGRVDGKLLNFNRALFNNNNNDTKD